MPSPDAPSQLSESRTASPSFPEFRRTVTVGGASYTPLLKAMYYQMVGHAARHMHIQDADYDLRTHLGIPLPTGHGKSLFIDAARRIIPELPHTEANHRNRTEVIEEPTSFHPEALVGRVEKHRSSGTSEYEQIPGAFAADYLALDDCIALWSEDREWMKQTRSYLQQATDPIQKNTITKRQSGVPRQASLRLTPTFSSLFCFQPCTLSTHAWQSGFLRRVLSPLVPIDPEEREEAITARKHVDHRALAKVINYLTGLREADGLLKFTEDAWATAKAAAMELKDRATDHAIIHPSVPSGLFTEAHGHIVKWACCQALLDRRTTVHEDDVYKATEDFAPCWMGYMTFIALCMSGSFNFSRLSRTTVRVLSAAIGMKTLADLRQWAEDAMKLGKPLGHYLDILEDFDFLTVDRGGTLHIHRPYKIWF